MLVIDVSLEAALEKRVSATVLVENRLNAAYPILGVGDEFRCSRITCWCPGVAKPGISVRELIVLGHEWRDSGAECSVGVSGVAGCRSIRRRRCRSCSGRRRCRPKKEHDSDDQRGGGEQDRQNNAHGEQPAPPWGWGGIPPVVAGRPTRGLRRRRRPRRGHASRWVGGTWPTVVRNRHAFSLKPAVYHGTHEFPDSY